MAAFRRLVLVLSVLLVLPCVASAQQAPQEGRPLDVLMHPESVAAGDNGTFYAANIGETLAPSAKDGDGFIARLSGEETVQTLRYLPAPSSDATLHAPKGTVVLDGHLYTADIDRVVGFALAERTKTTEVSLAENGVSFLNDVAVLDAQTLLVSASNQGTIYRVDLAAGTATALDVNVPGVNGLVYVADTQALYAVTFGGEQGGMLWTITLDEAGTVANTAAQTIVERGRLDGIARQPNGQLLISDWGAEGDDDSVPALHRVDPSGNGSTETITLSDWQGPADFVCEHPHGCWIPDLPASTVCVVHPGGQMEK